MSKLDPASCGADPKAICYALPHRCRGLFDVKYNVVRYDENIFKTKADCGSGQESVSSLACLESCSGDDCENF